MTTAARARRSSARCATGLVRADRRRSPAQPAAGAARGPFAVRAQREVGLEMAARWASTTRAGAWTTPCTRSRSRIAPADVRVTARFDEDDLTGCSPSCTRSATASTSSQVDPALARTTLGTGVSLGVHESQSRLWENLVGRSRAVLGAAGCRARSDAVPGAARPRPRRRSCARSTSCGRRSSASRPTRRPTRCTSILRFELEVALIEGDARGRPTCPAAWDEGMRDLLGIDRARRPRAARCRTSTGPSASSATSRPTRSATIVAAQLWEAARADLPGPRRALDAGATRARCALAGRARPPPRPPAGARRSCCGARPARARPRPAAGPPAREARGAPLTPRRTELWLAAHPWPLAPSPPRGAPPPPWRSCCSWPPRSPARPAPAAATAPAAA